MTLLHCPDCRSSESLSTLESIWGLSECERVTSDGPEWTGNTEVLYDTSVTAGISCECGWEYEGEDWAEQLVS